MLKTEKQAAVSLALVYAFRMIGLFMILPVFSLYASDYAGATPILIGLSIGIYGLTQGLFQLPFGFLSDRVGRKKMIILGLLLFVAGSMVAAMADSIHQIIFGRALQGMGAIAAVVMALAADLSREEVRMRVMASIGMSIGMAFMLSMILGPIFAANFGISGIFWITSMLALLSIFIILFITPTPEKQSFHRDTQLSIGDISKVLADRELLRLDLGVFVLHMVLAATFVLFPLILRDQLQIEVLQHWKTYLSVFIISIVIMVPMIIVAEKKRKMKPMFLVGILVVGLAEVGLYLFNGYVPMFIMLVLFFAGFNFLEASMPSLVAKISPADMKGTAMGLFSSAQFLGAFAGGLLGGVMLAYESQNLAFLQLAVLVMIWWIVAFFMKKPKAVTSRIVSLGKLDESSIISFREKAEQLPGVQEITVYLEDKVAYMKIDKKLFDDDALEGLMAK
ncbi:MAG: MFS transporter [Gammaproteobacteria bacterium]|jgi:MFS family permease|nr:MFS transporter [Gammaproteobacteria bacterium]MBT3726099.1 MFS transporter [Gammaproteobacteria bacterium]MBT4077408.1 MFS transporter [Gammaproteobacteria bacterium]MBT4448332.1 MFS transporter [Gammaproteobacteria bacterium]MBT4863348.1 MFS transporter [Gammaproteobacteria bacterium]